MAHTFLFQARDASGRQVEEYIDANTLDQAKYVLEVRGYQDVVFLNDAAQAEMERAITAETGVPAIDPDCWTAKDQVEGLRRKGIAAHLWWALKNHLIAILPLAWWNYSSWTGERPFGWGDWTGFVLSPLYALFFFKLSLPYMLFQKIMEATVWCNWTELRRFVYWARVLRRFMITGIPESELDFREAEALAAEGNLSAALAKVERWRTGSAMSPAVFLTRVASLHEHAGDYRTMVGCVEEAARVTPADANQWIELAAARVRRMRDVAGAKAALENVGDAELAALPAAFKHFALGMIAVEEGDDTAAVTHLNATLEKLTRFAGIPLIQLLETEAKGYLLIAEARSGRHEDARLRFAEVRALLRLHRGDDLYPRCEALVAG